MKQELNKEDQRQPLHIEYLRKEIDRIVGSQIHKAQPVGLVFFESKPVFAIYFFSILILLPADTESLTVSLDDYSESHIVPALIRGGVISDPNVL